MMGPALRRTIEDIEDNLPGWNWLLRSNPGKGNFFAHLMSPDFDWQVTVTSGGEKSEVTAGKSYKVYADTPELALRMVYLQAVT